MKTVCAGRSALPEPLTLRGQVSAISADLLPKTGGSKRWAQLPGAAGCRRPAPVQDAILSRMAAGRCYSAAEIAALLPGRRLAESVRSALYALEMRGLLARARRSSRLVFSLTPCP